MTTSDLAALPGTTVEATEAQDVCHLRRPVMIVSSICVLSSCICGTVIISFYTLTESETR